jgi:MFS superfamily sulfate permease-like transporter
MQLKRTDSKNKKRPVFRLERELSINNIESVKGEIDKIISSEKEGFHLELVDIENIDLTAIQILLALKKKLGDRFSFSTDLKKDISVLLEHTGINRYIQ